MGRVEAGEAHAVGLAGEPGVGKSRLLFEVTHSPHVAGWLVLEAAAVSHGKATSYLPVRDLLGVLPDHGTRRDVREKVTGRTPRWIARSSLPCRRSWRCSRSRWTYPRWRGLDPSGHHQRTLHAVTQLLVREAHAQPVLLVFGVSLDRRRDAGTSGYPRRRAVRCTAAAAHQLSPAVSAGLGERDAVHRAPSGSAPPSTRTSSSTTCSGLTPRSGS